MPGDSSEQTSRVEQKIHAKLNRGIGILSKLRHNTYLKN